MGLKDIQKKIERLEAEKEVAIKSREGQGRGIPLGLIHRQQKKDAERFEQQIAPLKLRKEHMIELRQWRFGFIGLIFGLILGLLPLIADLDFQKNNVAVSFIQQKNVTSDAYFVMAEGAIFLGNGDLNGVDVVRVDCNLQSKACVQNGFGLTKSGLTVLYNSKTYTIVESTASRVVGEYIGLTQTHHIEINLLTKEVVLTETDNGSSDTRVFQLEDGTSALEKMKKGR